MEPENNIQSGVPEVKPVANEAPKEDIVFSNKPKKKTGMILGMVLFAILAIGGIGFGVWAWMDGNTQKEALNEQIDDLTTQNSELLEKLGIDSEDIGTDINRVGIYKNPVIKSKNSDDVYKLYFTSTPVWDNDGNSMVVELAVKDGSIEYCNVGNKQWLDNGGSAFTKVSDCSITGLEGDIYTIVEFGEGQDNLYNNIGFVMTDGTVKYLPLYDSVENSNYAIRGSLNIDGYVVNAFDVDVSSESLAGGGVSTVFVLNDGSFVKYDTSMLAQ
ncbi:hypothetical protein IKG29_02175 [Candidatus Saccharibacteria bacterium]|nr:hypothetical protein [Candidatus Saccharibacteria bacterium]